VRTAEAGLNGVPPTNGSSAPHVSAPPHTVEELVVLDKAGRLQLPGDQRVLAGIGRRARVELVDGGILIRATDTAGYEGEPADAALDAASHPGAAPDGAAAYHSLYSEEKLAAAGPRRRRGGPLAWLFRRREKK
jgi:hypothetical protein